MNFDFEYILFLAVVISGVIWLIDTLLFAADRAAKNSKRSESRQKKEPVLVEYARAFFPVLLIVLLLRSFLVEPFRIPSGSMIPTLHIGDFILVNKFKYGIRLPVLNTKVLDMQLPQHGDVVVFRYPRNPEIDYIKRVVGVPGDKIRYFNKTLSVNGKLLNQKIKGPYDTECAQLPGSPAFVIEETSENVTHDIIQCRDRPERPYDFTVPDGQYFVMGDNRDNSSDSRVWGFVPEANLVGNAFFIWMSIDTSINSSKEGLFGFLPFTVAWDRIGAKVQ